MLARELRRVVDIMAFSVVSQGECEGAGGVEDLADGRALGLEALGEEGVAGAQLADGPRERRLRRVDPAATKCALLGPGSGSASKRDQIRASSEG
jgi:hypothetical protein